jgi:hypothetical protein
MPRRFIELVVRARRLVSRTANPKLPHGRARPTARRQLGGELTQFSFRLAFMIDLAYVGIGALGGAALGRASAPGLPADHSPSPNCSPDSATDRGVPARATPNAEPAPADTARPPAGLDTPPRVIR